MQGYFHSFEPMTSNEFDEGIRIKSLPSVVVTHHAPSFRSISPEFAKSPLNPGFASDLEKFILKHSPEIWIHGHIHESADYQIGKTRVVCNPLGYSVDGPGAAFENLKWDPGKMVRIEVSGS
jgi:Icc-related predicted phosphoesterase